MMQETAQGDPTLNYPPLSDLKPSRSTPVPFAPSSVRRVGLAGFNTGRVRPSSPSINKHSSPAGEDEIGRVFKKRRGQLTVALCYPNSYFVGMSNLGLHTIYRALNAREDCLCERFFLSPEKEQRLSSIESGRLLNEFEVIAFSISYESDYPNVISMLAQAELPLWAAQRTERAPLILAGGMAVTLNPEPLALFLDAVAVGEGEELIGEIADALLAGREAEKSETLTKLAALSGMYIPALYEVRQSADGILKGFKPLFPNAAWPIRRRIYSDFPRHPGHAEILTPHTEFGDLYLLEISRGCPYRCRFCAAGSLGKPFRPASFEALEPYLEAGLKHPGRVGLISASVGSHPELKRITEYLLARGGGFSPAALRLETVDEAFAAALGQSGLKTVSLAPETAAPRLKKLMAKDWREEDLFNAASLLVKHGILNLKLYFMVGLPTETDAEVEAIPDLVRRLKAEVLKEARAQGRLGKIALSVNSFVPKPVTPWQWAAMCGEDDLKRRLGIIKAGLKREPNVTVTHDLPKWAHWQGILARGDRRTGELLVLFHEQGGDLKKTLNKWNVDPEFYTRRERGDHEIFPWEIIDHGLERQRLFSAWQAVSGQGDKRYDA